VFDSYEMRQSASMDSESFTLHLGIGANSKSLDLLEFIIR